MPITQDRQRFQQTDMVLVRERHRREEGEPIRQLALAPHPFQGCRIARTRANARPARNHGDLCGIDVELLHDVVLGPARRHHYVRCLLTGFGVQTVAPVDLTLGEELRKVTVLEIPRLVDERELRPERHGEREVDHLDGLLAEGRIGAFGVWVAGLRLLTLPEAAVGTVHVASERPRHLVSRPPVPLPLPQARVPLQRERPGHHPLIAAGQLSNVRLERLRRDQHVLFRRWPLMQRLDETQERRLDAAAALGADLCIDRDGQLGVA